MKIGVNIRIEGAGVISTERIAEIRNSDRELEESEFKATNILLRKRDGLFYRGLL